MKKIINVGYWSNSLMNGGVLDPDGICRTIMVGAHSGCAPVIIEMRKYGKVGIRNRPLKGQKGKDM